jgi:uncharacterized protein (DUF1499 family)
VVADLPIDFSTVRRSRRPNQCLALAPDIRASSAADITSPVFDASPHALRRAFDAAVADEPRLEVARESADGLQIELVQRTRWLGFRDWIVVGFVALDDRRAALLIWSRSETGIYDFGVNRARVRRWLAGLARHAEG